MATPDLATEAARRRTFAIISHPDAGKTTLTENLLLAGGAIRLAGEVRARGETRRTRSDWMKIERERGISVSASVMTFERDGVVFNLLDTPGHEDFSEDTYRTLTAADSAVMVLDAAKGIEPQTLKLFEVCRLRDIPIVTFINKMDREALDPFALLDEVHEKLALDVAPVFWPAGSGNRLRGMLDLRDDRFHVFRRPEAGEKETRETEIVPMASNHIAETMSGDELEELRETSDLARAGLPEFDLLSYREGHMTPVFFGSALRKFGVIELLEGLAAYAPPPRAQKATLRSKQAAPAAPGGDKDAGQEARGPVSTVAPDFPEVSGFVFKIQANMDPKHRDRVAMMRVCSGRFRRGMTLKTATGKALNVHAPLMFMAQDREITEEAWPGDVIGVPNHGALRVGDSLSESGAIVYAGIPNFAPEILKRCRVADPLKQKHLRKALEGMAEEGVTQLFKPVLGADLIVGAVGALQFDVLEERLRAENGLEVMFEQSPYQAARWISADNRADLEAFMDRNKSQSAEDLDGAPVFLGKTAWEIGYVQEKNPKVRFTGTKERA